MKLSELADANWAVMSRSNAKQDLDVLLSVANRGQLLAEVAFFHDRDEQKNRVFVDGEGMTRSPYEVQIYRKLTEKVANAVKEYLMEEIRLCDLKLQSLGITIDD